jgi:hypothetical protein
MVSQCHEETFFDVRDQHRYIEWTLWAGLVAAVIVRIIEVAVTWFGQ